MISSRAQRNILALLYEKNINKKKIDFNFFFRKIYLEKMVKLNDTREYSRVPAEYAIQNNMEMLCAFCTNSANKTCERCGEFYCSRPCQISDWRKHRYVCIPLP